MSELPCRGYQALPEELGKLEAVASILLAEAGGFYSVAGSMSCQEHRIAAANDYCNL